VLAVLTIDDTHELEHLRTCSTMSEREGVCEL
jgi:hypothetical protein